MQKKTCLQNFPQYLVLPFKKEVHFDLKKVEVNSFSLFLFYVPKRVFTFEIADRSKGRECLRLLKFNLLNGGEKLFGKLRLRRIRQCGPVLHQDQTHAFKYTMSKSFRHLLLLLALASR